MRRLVAVAMPAGPGFVEELQRAWEAGDAVLPIDLRLAPPARARLIAALRPAVLVTGGDVGARSRQDVADPLPVEGEDALVMATSGTTGEPKGVVLTHGAVAASAAATSARLGVDPGNDAWWACLPLSHVGGMSVVTRSLLGGVRCEVVGGFSAEGAAAALERGATLTSLVPTTLRRLGDDLASRFRRIVLGGAAPPSGLAPNVVTTYGLTETGSGVVYDGVPLDHVEVRVLDGEVQLRAPMLLRAYRDGRDPKDASGWLPTGDAGEIAGDGRLLVFGRLGELIITGGENVWPSAVEPLLLSHPLVADAAVAGAADVEWGDRVVAYVALSAAVSSGSGGVGPPVAGAGPEERPAAAVRPVAGAGPEERPAAAVRPVAGADREERPAAAALLAELRELVSSELAAFAAPRELVIVESIPRTALGKVRRNELPTLRGPSASI